MTIILLSLFAFTFCAKADGDKPIAYSELPAASRQFVTEHFSKDKVAAQTKDFELFGSTYNVFFTNGNHIEFYSNGEWKDVECRRSAVPEKIIPQPIKDFLKNTYENISVTKIEKERHSWYEVRLSNGLELTFDQNGRVADIDD